MNGGLKCLLHFPGDKETTALLGFSAVCAAKPSIVLGILRFQFDCPFAVRNRTAVVLELVIGPQSPKMQRSILRRLGQSGCGGFGGGGIISRSKLRSGGIRRSSGGQTRRGVQQDQNEQKPKNH